MYAWLVCLVLISLTVCSSVDVVNPQASEVWMPVLGNSSMHQIGRKVPWTAQDSHDWAMQMLISSMVAWVLWLGATTASFCVFRDLDDELDL